MTKEKYGKIIFDNEEKEFIIKKYREGVAIHKIAKEFSVSGTIISNCLKEGRVHIRTDREQALKYHCNESYFENIDSEEKAYWLGFIYADGFIQSKREHGSRKLGISLGIKDKNHLEKFKKTLNSTHPIKEYKVSGGYKVGTAYCRILITSEKIVSDLEGKGVLENKTTKLYLPQNILDSEFSRDFVRGFMDGDGSISLNKGVVSNLKFCGTEEAMIQIKRYFGAGSICRKKGVKMENYREFSIGGEAQLEKCLDILYENSTIFLDRKYNRYLKLKNQRLQKTGK